MSAPGIRTRWGRYSSGYPKSIGMSVWDARDLALLVARWDCSEAEAVRQLIREAADREGLPLSRGEVEWHEVGIARLRQFGHSIAEERAAMLEAAPKEEEPR